MDRKDKDNEAINRFWYNMPYIELTINHDLVLTKWGFLIVFLISYSFLFLNRDNFNFIGSMIYAILLIVIGCVLYATDIFAQGHKTGSIRAQVCLIINHYSDGEPKYLFDFSLLSSQILGLWHVSMYHWYNLVSCPAGWYKPIHFYNEETLEEGW